MRENQSYTEQELLRLIGEDDEEAFTRLFLSYRQQIYTAAVRITGDKTVAEDIYQDVFLSVWLKRKTLAGIENFPGWLFIVARNKIYDAVKKLSIGKTDRLDFIAETSDEKNISQDQQLYTKQLQEILHQAVSRLPHKQRETYLLIKHDSLSREEAAKRLNVSPETVKSNLDHAMRSIRVYCLSRLGASIIFLLTILK